MKLVYRANQALLSSPALSAALLLGKIRAEARYPEGTAPHMSPPGPPACGADPSSDHCWSPWQRGRKGQSPCCYRFHLGTRSHFASQFIGQCTYHGQPEFRSRVRGLEDPCHCLPYSSPRAEFLRLSLPHGPLQVIFLCICVSVCAGIHVEARGHSLEYHFLGAMHLVF